MFIPQLSKVCLLLLFITLLPAKADIYKWVDDESFVNFTQQPPADRPYEQITVPPPPPLSEEVLIEENEAPDDAEATAEAQRQAEQQQAQQEAALAAFRQQSCEIAKQNLQTYEDNPGRRFINDAGEVTRPTEEERQLKMQQFRQDIEKFC